MFSLLSQKNVLCFCFHALDCGKWWCFFTTRNMFHMSDEFQKLRMQNVRKFILNFIIVYILSSHVSQVVSVISVIKFVLIQCLSDVWYKALLELDSLASVMSSAVWLYCATLIVHTVTTKHAYLDKHRYSLKQTLIFIYFKQLLNCWKGQPHHAPIYLSIKYQQGLWERVQIPRQLRKLAL